MKQNDLASFDSHNDVGSAVQKCPSFWIEIELVDEENQPVPEEQYKIELPDGKTVQGRLGAKGLAYAGNIGKGGNCKITFPNLDKDAWKKI